MNPKTIAAFTLGLGLAVTAHSQSFLTNGLVAYYPFDGNANDASGHGNNGTIYGGVVPAPDRFGVPNSAYAFNGVDGYIDIGSPTGTNSVYLAETAWVKINSRVTAWEPISPPRDVIISKRQSTNSIGSGWPELGIDANTGAGIISVAADFYLVDCTGTTQTQTNAWVFICGVRSNSTYQIYINGALENTIVNTRTLSSFEPTHLMHGGAWYTFCNGVLDDVRIYNRALSPDEVQQLYVSESPGPFVNLLKAVKPLLTSLSPGTNYQLQVSSDLHTWTNQGLPFIATDTSMVFPQYFDVTNWNALYFRLQVAQ